MAFSTALLSMVMLLQGGADAAPMQVRVLDLHNKARAEVGSPPLVWNAALARDAQGWADVLAKRGTLDHAERIEEGENLWLGTRGAYTFEEMVGSWVEEKTFYKPGRFPDVVVRGDWSEVGHYTQLIWADTREVGCAIASNAADDFLVCRYNPGGNVIGEWPVRGR